MKNGLVLRAGSGTLVANKRRKQKEVEFLNRRSLSSSHKQARGKKDAVQKTQPIYALIFVLLLLNCKGYFCVKNQL